MTLIDVQEVFNANFNIGYFKSKTENGLKSYLDDYEFLTREYANDLPLNFKKEDLYGEYSFFQLIINKTNSIPIFRVRYVVKIKGGNVPKFWYEMEFDSEGQMQDDYFDVFSIVN